MSNIALLGAGSIGQTQAVSVTEAEGVTGARPEYVFLERQEINWSEVL